MMLETLKGEFVCLPFSWRPCAEGRCCERKASCLSSRAELAVPICCPVLVCWHIFLSQTGRQSGTPEGLWEPLRPTVKGCAPHEIFYSHPNHWRSTQVLGWKEPNTWDASASCGREHEAVAGIKGIRGPLSL